MEITCQFVQRSLPPDYFTKRYPGLSDEELALAKIHDDPFYAECRAFGRLKETGMEHLAVKVHGYIQVDTNERTTEMFRSAFAMENWGEASNLTEFFYEGNIDRKSTCRVVYYPIRLCRELLMLTGTYHVA